jgi:uncharacterized protein (DUF4415 family)
VSRPAPEHPEWTAADAARPLREADPALYAKLRGRKRRGRGPQKRATKVAVSLRLERAALAAYRATGRGWQSRLSADISAAAKRLKRRRPPAAG